MKLNSVSCPSFQKTLVAHAKFTKNIQDGKPQDCKIYVLDSYNDIGYFSKLRNKESWKNPYFLDNLECELPSCLDSRGHMNTYVMEMGDEGECIAYAQSDRDYNTSKIDYLETAPIYQNSPYNPSCTNVKYIGETFLAFFAKQAKQQRKGKIELIAIYRALPFYKEKCGFVSSSPWNNFVLSLPCDRYKHLIKQNKKHIGSKLTIEG